MVKVRQDAWSHEDDLLLAETVLRHIREGSTQLRAFDEVGDKLNRTSAACGFRWNAEIRKKYISAIDLAKRQRKEKKRAQAQLEKRGMVMALPEPEAEFSEAGGLVLEPAAEETEAVVQPAAISLDHVIHYLRTLKKQTAVSGQSAKKLSRLEEENSRLQDQLQSLDAELSETKKQLETIQEDYNTFIRIMERARKLTVLDDDRTPAQPAFRMDQNGNLEQVIHQTN